MAKITGAFRECGKAPKYIRGKYGSLFLRHGADLCVCVCLRSYVCACVCGCECACVGV